MQSIQQQVRRQQRVEELCGAAIRALTSDPELHLRAQGLYRGQRRLPLYAPHLRTDPVADDIDSHRGASDGMALRLLHSDADLHRSLCPEEPLQRLVFELLEQLRVESLAPADKPGIATNLVRRFTSWSVQYHHAGLTGSELGILLYTLAQVCWARLNACRVLDETEDLIEATRAGIVPLIGQHLVALKRNRGNQAGFAQAALAIARQVHEWIEHAEAGKARGADADEADGASGALKFLLDFDQQGDAVAPSVISAGSKVFAEAAAGYRVFSTQYDREVGAAVLVRPALLKELRARLDHLVMDQGINVRRLARHLAAMFAQPGRDGWLFGEEEGQIDGRRLTQVVSSPHERRLFRRERLQPRPDTLFSLLIDCSGSMKAHIESLAVLVDILVRALQQAGVTSEVLGFTTGAWNGGRVQRDWMAAGRPKHPGRLNELSYIVYKDADTSWRRARLSIAAMLKPDLFREGVDGEAVDWACSRMSGRSETQRVLMVISDGCPMDAATSLANDPFYLDNHLQEVVARHERHGEVDIYGLGVGLDLSTYYRRRLALDLTRGVDNRVFDEIVGLLRRSWPR
jgi:cobaltochelatase CobT